MKKYLVPLFFLLSAPIFSQTPAPFYCQQTIKLMVYAFPMDLGTREVFGPLVGEGHSMEDAKLELERLVIQAEKQCDKKSKVTKNSWCTKTAAACYVYYPNIDDDNFFGNSP